MSRPKGAPPMGRALLLSLPVAAGAAIAFALRRYRRFEVTGESMSPGLYSGDYVVVDRLAFLSRPPRLGDVVLARDPRTPGRTLVKRVAEIDGAGRLWLLGDNAAASTDSRAFGWVEPPTLAGRVVWRYWPVSRAGRIR